MSERLSVTVQGPNIQSTFGDNHSIQTVDQIREHENGTLEIETSGISNGGRKYEKRVVYAKGEWTKYVIMRVEFEEAVDE